jgi:hypothetical protein
VNGQQAAAKAERCDDGSHNRQNRGHQHASEVKQATEHATDGRKSTAKEQAAQLGLQFNGYQAVAVQRNELLLALAVIANLQKAEEAEQAQGLFEHESGGALDALAGRGRGKRRTHGGQERDGAKAQDTHATRQITSTKLASFSQASLSSGPIFSGISSAPQTASGQAQKTEQKALHGQDQSVVRARAK